MALDDKFQEYFSALDRSARVVHVTHGGVIERLEVRIESVARLGLDPSTARGSKSGVRSARRTKCT